MAPVVCVCGGGDRVTGKGQGTTGDLVVGLEFEAADGICGMGVKGDRDSK